MILGSWNHFHACAQRGFQRKSAWRDRQVIRRADFIHHPVDEVVEDQELAVEGFDKFFIWLNPHDQLRKHIVPADDIDPASLGNVELSLVTAAGSVH